MIWRPAEAGTELAERLGVLGPACRALERHTAAQSMEIMRTILSSGRGEANLAGLWWLTIWSESKTSGVAKVRRRHGRAARIKPAVVLAVGAVPDGRCGRIEMIPAAGYSASAGTCACTCACYSASCGEIFDRCCGHPCCPRVRPRGASVPARPCEFARRSDHATGGCAPRSPPTSEIIEVAPPYHWSGPDTPHPTPPSNPTGPKGMGGRCGEASGRFCPGLRRPRQAVAQCGGG